MSILDNYEIVTNNEQISFNHFIKRLYEICRDCNHEVYLAEIFLSFLTMCCPEGIKVVPIFDDRKVGRKTDNSTEIKKRMETICAHKSNDEYVVPDFIFVPLEYSFVNPCKPYLMVETKLPNFPEYKKANKGNYYCPLENTIKKNESELLPEINACNSVIYTDGITWMFLESENNEIKVKTDYETIKFVDQHEYHTKRDTGCRVTEKHKIINIDLSFLDPSLKNINIVTNPDEWEMLKNMINNLLEDKLKPKTL